MSVQRAKADMTSCNFCPLLFCVHVTLIKRFVVPYYQHQYRWYGMVCVRAHHSVSEGVCFFTQPVERVGVPSINRRFWHIEAKWGESTAFIHKAHIWFAFIECLWMWAEFIHTNLLLIEHTKIFFYIKSVESVYFRFYRLRWCFKFFKLPGFAIIPIFLFQN